jgi:lambda family phage portal protein
MAAGADLRRLRSKRGGVVLYDPAGRPFDATATTVAWKGARETRRTRSWRPTDASVNALLANDVEELRRKSRDLVRKNAWAQNGIEHFVANAVGTGIVPHPLTQDDAFRAELLEAWEDWTQECDADGTQDFYGMQALICRSYIEGGDCFVRVRDRRESDGLSVPLQLQALEAELCEPSYEQNLGPGRKIQAGIEFDSVGRRIAYHMFRDHPGDYINLRGGERIPVPARNVLHVFQPTRAGQLRGVPGLATIIAKLWELEKYDDAEVMRKQVAAMYAGFIRKPDALSNPLGGGGIEGVDEDGVELARLEPGTMQELGPGEDVVFSGPSDVGNSYEPFLKFQLRQAAAAIGVTYEHLTGDYQGVTFSSVRASWIEFRRRISLVQRNILIFQLCRPVWRRFVEAAVLSGRVAVPAGVPPRNLFRVRWTTPGWEYVDPEKEARAKVIAVRAGFTSRSRVVAEQGLDAEALDREIAIDNARADRLGLCFDCDARGDADGSARAAAVAPRPARDRDDEDETEAEDE